MDGPEPSRQLGVGLIYWSGLAPLFEAGVVDVLELEPQTIWEKVAWSGEWRYRVNHALLDRVASYPQPKLLHGVGQPLGGVTPDPVEHVTQLKQAVRRLRPAWVSEHLSFNRFHGPHGPVEVGFLLPPRQSPASVRVAAANIRAYREALGCPVAFETGVNYLQARGDELPDGDFFADVAETASCGILLDLHNLWCNEVNGRARVLDVIDRLPLDRVWEIHLAGGAPHHGYWLDSHSSGVPEPLVDLAAEVIARLPSLGAINFEVLPEHLDAVGLDAVQQQVEQLRGLWRLRPAQGWRSSEHAAGAADCPTVADEAEVREWERRLAAAITRPGTDPGLTVYKGLIVDARSGGLARTLRYTMTALLTSLGGRETRRLLDAYFAVYPPDAYAAVEAHHFARYLRARPGLLSTVPYLDEILAFEHALVRATLFGTSSDLRWTVDPASLLESLESGRPPAHLPAIDTRMRLLRRRRSDPDVTRGEGAVTDCPGGAAVR